MGDDLFTRHYSNGVEFNLRSDLEAWEQHRAKGHVILPKGVENYLDPQGLQRVVHDKESFNRQLDEQS